MFLLNLPALARWVLQYSRRRGKPRFRRSFYLRRASPRDTDSSTPVLQHSSTPVLQHSNNPTIQYSNTPLLLNS
jgi:hypothetical protein